MSKAQVMASSLFFAFCISVVASTDGTVTRNRERKTSSDIFRQMLNQETIIRLSLTKTIEDMRKDMLIQKQITASLEKDVKNLKTESDLLRQDNTLLKQQLSQHRSSFSTLNNTMQILNGNIKNIRENVSDITYNQGKEPRQKVGFTAEITSSKSGWSGSTLVFPKLVYSVGGGYDTSTGVFTSPTAGVFVFYVAVQSSGTNAIRLDIMLNNTTKVSTLAYTASYAASSNLVVLQLEKGDRVHVERGYGKGFHSLSSPLTTFSGFML